MSEPTDVDASVLQPLADLRRRETAVRGYLARAEQSRAKVSEPVYGKVTDDYRQRLASIEQEAGSLRDRARGEYRKLLDAYERLSAPEEEARFALEELTLRHAAGEIDDAQLAARQRQPAEALERCRDQREALDRLKAEFVEVLEGAGGEAAGQPAPTGFREPEPSVVRQPSVRLPQSAVQPASTRQVAPQHAAPSQHAAPVPAGAARTSNRDTAAAPSSPASATASAVAEPPPGDETTMVPLGFLTIVEGPGAPAEYVLAETTYIGRGEDCHLRIVHPTVSRHHAIVAASREGFRIRDLGSQNGTLVNGEQADDQLLADRDEILIGEALLVFSRDRPSRVG